MAEIQRYSFKGPILAEEVVRAFRAPYAYGLRLFGIRCRS